MGLGQEASLLLVQVVLCRGRDISAGPGLVVWPDGGLVLVLMIEGGGLNVIPTTLV